MPDIDDLLTQGNIAFYKSCEVTQIFLHNKKLNTVTNFYILACLHETFPSTGQASFLGKRYPIDGDTNLCIQKYYLNLSQVSQVQAQLVQDGKWNFDGDTSLQLGKLKQLAKQFVPSSEGNRLNHILKNNFHAGSYIIEFFDEAKKQVNFIYDMEEKKLDELSDHIYKEVPINLSVVRERIGNIIFQFPVNLVEINSSSLKSGDGIHLNFSWHKQLSVIPDCHIQAESTLDNNLIGATIETYNKTNNQVITTGNTDSMNRIQLWRNSPPLILFNFTAAFLKRMNINMQIQNPEPRIFEVNGKVALLNIYSERPSGRNEAPTYSSLISAQVNNVEKQALAKSLSFKQYNRYGHEDALNDLRTLIKTRTVHSVYLWDPFLTAEDVLKTLYYTKKAGTILRAIGSIDKTVKRIYKTRSQTSKQIIAAQQKILSNPKNNNLGLHLEFRMQHGTHGWSFHDRFLLFPGDASHLPRAYSLGTSINSFGEKHHILQEVSYARPLIDAFDDLWNKLDKPECIVWKYPL